MAGRERRELREVVVLGGAGFLGRWVVDELVGRGIAVTSVDRDPRGRLDGSGAVSVQADVAAGERGLAERLRAPGLDAVVVLVGTGSVPRSIEHPLGDLASNAGSVVAVLEALRGLDDPPLVVHLSSAAVYGNGVTLPMAEDHPLEPVSPYGISKLAAERYLRLYHELYGIPALSLRPFSLYGPGQRKLVVHDLLRRILAGEDPLVVRGAAAVTRDLVYVADAARALVDLALAAPGTGEALNVSSGRGTSLGALADALVAAAGTEGRIEFTGDVRPGDPLRWEGDGAAAAALGVRCDTALAEGLAATVAWLRADGAGAADPR